MMVIHWWAGSHVGRQLAIAGHHVSDSFCRAYSFHDPITPPGSNAHRKSDRKLKTAVRIPLTRTNLDTKASRLPAMIDRTTALPGPHDRSDSICPATGHVLSRCYSV